METTARGAFDLSSFDGRNIARIAPWCRALENLLKDWKGGFFFSDNEEPSKKRSLEAIGRMGLDADLVLQRSLESRSYEFCLSFNLATEDYSAALPSCSRKIWALGGRPESDWKRQWENLLAMEVDEVVCEALPEELPEDFGQADANMLASKFRYLAPGPLDPECIETRETVIGKIVALKESDPSPTNTALDLLWKRLPEGSSSQRVIALENQPQWIQAIGFERLAESEVLIVPRAGRLSPLRWTMMGHWKELGADWRSDGGRLREMFQSILKKADLSAKPKNNEVSNSENLLFGSEGIIFSGLYRKAQTKNDQLSKYSFCSANSVEERWRVSPIFQGIVWNVLETDCFDELFGILSDSSKFQILGCALCYAKELKEDAYVEACLKQLQEVESFEYYHEFGLSVWETIRTLGIADDLILSIAYQLIEQGLTLRIIRNERDEMPLALLGMSLFEVATDRWNYGDRNYNTALLYLGRLEEVKRNLQDLEAEYSLPIGFRSRFVDSFLKPIRQCPDNPNTLDRLADIIEFSIELLQRDLADDSQLQQAIDLLAEINNWVDSA